MLKLTLLEGDYGVARLAPSAPAPDLSTAPFASVTRTAEELSVTAPEAMLAGAEVVEGGWRVFKVEGPLDFALTGILSKLAGVLAENEISLFALSTYDTDYFLVKRENAARAADLWRGMDYQVSGVA